MKYYELVELLAEYYPSEVDGVVKGLVDVSSYVQAIDKLMLADVKLLYEKKESDKTLKHMACITEFRCISDKLMALLTGMNKLVGEIDDKSKNANRVGVQTHTINSAHQCMVSCGKPVSFKICGETIGVPSNEWSDFYKAVCDYLVLQDKPRFKSFISGQDMFLNPEPVVNFADRPKDLYCGKSGSKRLDVGIFINVHLSVDRMLLYIRYMLTVYQIELSDFEFSVRDCNQTVIKE